MTSGEPSPQDWPGTQYMDNREVEAAVRVLTARSPFRYYGPDPQHEADSFESELARVVGRQFCLGVASGTTALETALAAMGVGPGDEVVIPGYFWVSTAGAVVRNGAIPVLADIDDSFSLDPLDLEQKIGIRTKAVILIHMCGAMGQVERIAEVCRRKGVLLLEDCAQALGAAQFGRSCGQFGDVAIFSFQLNKNCTAGEGGAVVTDDAELFEKMVAIHDLGYPRDASGRLVAKDDTYQSWGLGCRMNEITAAVLRVQLQKLPSIVNEMRAVKRALEEVTAGYRRISPRAVPDPAGDTGGFLKMKFESHGVARAFQLGLHASGLRVRGRALYSALMMEWGLHLYYLNKSLVNKRSICGHHSVWELSENRFSAHHSYERGTLPRMDAMVPRVLIFPIPLGVDAVDLRALRAGFRAVCESVVPNAGLRAAPQFSPPLEIQSS